MNRALPEAAQAIEHILRNGRCPVQTPTHVACCLAAFLQILTHMKAKLAFIECENEALQQELRQLEGALAGKRDELASLKSTRDRLWQQQRQLKEGSVFVTNPMLLQDMQVRQAWRLAPLIHVHCDQKLGCAVSITLNVVCYSAGPTASVLVLASRVDQPVVAAPAGAKKRRGTI